MNQPTPAAVKFQQLFKAVATRENYVERPTAPMSDFWSADRWIGGQYFAVLADGGYNRYVGRRDINGTLLWAVHEKSTDSNTQYLYDGAIDEQSFINHVMGS